MNETINKKKKKNERNAQRPTNEAEKNDKF